MSHRVTWGRHWEGRVTSEKAAAGCEVTANSRSFIWLPWEVREGVTV